MASHAKIARKEQQNQRAELRREQVKLTTSEVSRSQLRDMRKLGFAPRKGVVTQKHFERYAAHLEAQATANRANALNNEVAVFNANGGLMASIFERLNKPGIKDTAFANLSAVALRAVSLAPALADKMRMDAAAGSSSLPDEDRIDSVIEKLGGEL
ncbi:hypothetical protein DK750_06945 [Salmonella enterica subsp. enterica serovar Rovaniemi]|nr:hypothetical protein [Salmonella enterica subsp. enterica serovar Rovaniemi]